MTQTRRKAAPNNTPSSPNTPGTARAATNIAISATSSAAPTRPSSGSTVFVSQAYAPHAHQSAASTSTPRPIPANVGSAVSNVATCVKANTKTRSKKSSRGVTRCSCSTAVTNIRRDPIPKRGAELFQSVTRSPPHHRDRDRENRGVAPDRGLDDVTEEHVRRAVDSLSEEFGEDQEQDTIERVMDDSIAQLAGGAEINDFVATLAYRFTRERLKAMGRAHGATDAPSEVLFIGLGDSGRGQIASALVTLRSEGRIVAHSAGQATAATVDPAVVAAMAELGVDLTDAYAKPLSTEVLEAADIVVTMGRSVGAVHVPDGTEHHDWRVGDPTGAPLDDARRVRDDIDRRVQDLLDSLDAETTRIPALDDALDDGHA